MEVKRDKFWKNVIRTVIEFILIAVIIYLMKDLFNLFIFTFLFSYLIYNLQGYIVNKTHLPRTLVEIGIISIIVLVNLS